MLLSEFGPIRIKKSAVQEEHTNENPMANAVTRRIIHSRIDLLQKYGPGAVNTAIDDVIGDDNNDWDEIGSSDVSNYVKYVERYLADHYGSREEMDDRKPFAEETDKKKYNQLVANLNAARDSGDMARAEKIGNQLAQLGGGKFDIDIHGRAKPMKDQITEQPAADQQQRILDKMGQRFGLPPGSSLEQVKAAQLAHLDKTDPAAAQAARQKFASIDSKYAAQPAAQPQTQAQPVAQPQAQPVDQPVAQPVAQLAAQPQQDPDTAAGLAAAKSGKDPLAIMLAQPSIANNRQALDAIASSYGLPAGLSAQEIQAQSQQATTQKALDDVARTVGLPPGMSRDQILAAFKKQQQDQFNKAAGVAPRAQTGSVGESREEKRNADGLTQLEWMKKIKSMGGKIVGMAKMPNGPIIGSLDGKKVSWTPVESVNEIDNPLEYERRQQRAMDREREQFKRDELEYELRGEEERIRAANEGTFYLRINGRIWRKRGQPVMFNGRQAAVRSGQTIKNRDPSKEVVVTVKPVDVAVKEFKDEEEAGDLRTGWLIKKAKRQFPMATSDAEAVAMWMNDKTEQEVSRIDRVNDMEDAMIDRLTDVDKKIQIKLQNIDNRLTSLEKSQPNESRSNRSNDISKYLAEMKKAGYDI